MGYWDNVPQPAAVPSTVPTPQVDNVETLRQQKEFLENQLKGLQDTIERISKRLDDLSEQ
jgi:chaperonin cofactor prefoldin